MMSNDLALGQDYCLPREKRMKDVPLEIIITTGENPDPQLVQFSDLYDLRESITSIMYLWNTNCYYVDVTHQTFIINGGRKLHFEMGPCRVCYRRRNQHKYAMNDLKGKPEKTQIHIVGLEKIGTEKRLILMISEDGQEWRWANKL